MSKDSIKAKGKIERIKTQLNELMDFLSENPDLPPSVEDAISMKQDVLMNDVASLNQRINQEADSQ
jgi:hypothetical protein